MTAKVLGRVLAGALGTVAGLALDRVVGEPPERIHPVALAGAALGRLEQVTYRDHRLAGAAHLGAAATTAAAVGLVLDRRLGRVAGSAVAVWVAAAPSMLGQLALDVGDALDQGDLPLAREAVGRLVGRDVSQLDETGVARAAVESVAENTVDAATATVFWAVVAGPVGVLVHRVVNTLDAMIGHRNDRYQRFGWSAARLDDALNWLPARCTAATVAALACSGGATGTSATAILAIVARDARQHPSPNGGVVEAAFAAALGRSLGGVNRYGDLVEDRGRLGDGPPAGPDTIAPAVALLHRSTWALVGAAVALGALLHRRSP